MNDVLRVAVLDGLATETTWLQNKRNHSIYLASTICLKYHAALACQGYWRISSKLHQAWKMP